MNDLTIGLPYPWKMRKLATARGRCFFWAISSRTFALGAESLQDGFVAFLGCFVVGWAKMPVRKSKTPGRVDA